MQRELVLVPEYWLPEARLEAGLIDDFPCEAIQWTIKLLYSVLFKTE